MGRDELPEIELAVAGPAPMGGEALFELGLMYSAGNSVPVDLVSAHKWFNLAAMKGYADAARLRREIAAEMTDAEIGKAQLAAREWLKLHPEPQAIPCVTPAPLQVAA
jgi:TPR repeat protein